MDYYRPVAYGCLNIVSASGIVFANKAVLSNFGFHFTYTLTLIHTLTTLAGMHLFLQAGIFEKKVLPKASIVPLAGAYVGYIVLCNLNLQINTVSFYQITKLAVAPTVLVIEWVYLGKKAGKEVIASIVLVCLGVGLSTITDMQVGTQGLGFLIGIGAVGATALYQIWAGTKQKELGAGSMQLLHQYCPIAAGFLAVLVPIMEPVGFSMATKDTLLGYEYTPMAVVAIAVSAVLGLLVSLSTFLVIGATSSLTYNVVGHIKTVIILAGGCLFFGDEMPLKKLAGIATAMVGIMWYSHLKMNQASSGPSKPIISKQLTPVLVGSGASGNYGSSDALEDGATSPLVTSRSTRRDSPSRQV